MLKIKEIYKSKLVAELNYVSTLTGYFKLYHFFDYMSVLFCMAVVLINMAKVNFTH